MSRLLDTLRPHPHRGDVIAAGALLLAVGALLIDSRFAEEWDALARLLVIGLATAVVCAMAWLAPMEGEVPRAYHSVLLVTALVLVGASLVALGQVLGADQDSFNTGLLSWVGTIVTLLAFWQARRFNAAASEWLGATSLVATAVVFVEWAFGADSLSTFRYVLLAGVIVCAAVAVSQRDVRRRHAVAWVNTAGLTAIAIAALLLISPFAELFIGESDMTVVGGNGPLFGVGAALGWELFLLLAGLALIGYAAVDREPAPGYFGAIVLFLFVIIAAGPDDDGASLIGWPLALLIVAGVLLAIGLRPRRELPPEPGIPVPATPLTPVGAPGDTIDPDAPTEVAP